MKKLFFTVFIIISLTNAFTQELAYSDKSGSEMPLLKPDKINADILIKNVNIIDVETGYVSANKYVAISAV